MAARSDEVVRWVASPGLDFSFPLPGSKTLVFAPFWIKLSKAKSCMAGPKSKNLNYRYLKITQRFKNRNSLLFQEVFFAFLLFLWTQYNKNVDFHFKTISLYFKAWRAKNSPERQLYYARFFFQKKFQARLNL
jgi:hypothetical protein